MPRDLIDLMERATSSAPPETHHATDITRLAAQRQRRRTSGIAAGVAAVLLVGAAAGYGVTRGHETAPEPAGPYKYGQELHVSDAVPADTLPGYALQRWTVPSLATFPTVSGDQTFSTYQDVDPEGRLLVVDHPSSDVKAPPRIRLYDAPGAAPHDLAQPPPEGSRAAKRAVWVPYFLGDGRLVWDSTGQAGISAPEGFHITDLDGGNDVYVDASFVRQQGREHFIGGSDHGRNIWGDRYWFKVFDHNLPGFQGAAFDLYTATFSGQLTEVSKNVASLAVGGGRVAWVTTKGAVMTESASGGTPQAVDVPLDEGCRINIQEMQVLPGMLAVGRDVISLAEACGRGKAETHGVVAFDLSGRRFVRITTPVAVGLTIDGRSLTFAGAASDEVKVLRYDLVTGTLATLGTSASNRSDPYPRVSGDYVLWYDKSGGHVARFAD